MITEKSRGCGYCKKPDCSGECLELQVAICTRSDDCLALPSDHEPDCPAEAALKEEFGF